MLLWDGEMMGQEDAYAFGQEYCTEEPVHFDESIKNQVWFAIINGNKTIVLIDDVDKDFGYLFSSFESPISHWSKKDCESLELVKRVEWPKD